MPVQPPTARVLLTELCRFIEDTVRGYPFPSPEGPPLDCHVFWHGLPDEQESETWPFIVCRWDEGKVESGEDGKSIVTDTVALILGVHAPFSQAQAGQLLAELLDVLRFAIWQKRLLADRFELVEPLHTIVPGMEQKVHQFHLATLETTWNYVWPPKAQPELTKTIALGRTSCAALGLASPQASCGSLSDALPIRKPLRGNGCGRSASARVPAGGSE